MKIDEVTEIIETSWDIGGLFNNIRDGKFDSLQANKFIDVISNLHFDENDKIPRRLISMLWYVPIFLEWQRERIKLKVNNITEYEAFVSNIQNALEEILGIP